MEFESIFNAIRPARGFEEIAQQIQQAIHDGILKPGDRLPNERELSNTFHVSRATLREALRLLEGAGIVEVVRGVHGGVFVTAPKPAKVAKSIEALIRFNEASIHDLVEFRGNFEGETAYWAAIKATPEQVQELIDIAEAYTRQIETAAWAELVELDVMFHQKVANASQNSIRIAIMYGIYGALFEASLALTRLDEPDLRKKAAEDLVGIAQAIAQRESDRARDFMLNHVEWNSKLEKACMDDPS